MVLLKGSHTDDTEGKPLACIFEKSISFLKMAVFDEKTVFFIVKMMT